MASCWFGPLVILKSVKCDGLHLGMLECASLEYKQAIKWSPVDCAACESISLYLHSFPLSKYSVSRSQDIYLLAKTILMSIDTSFSAYFLLSYQILQFRFF